MKGGFQFFRTTLLGGLVFLVPFVVVTAIVGKGIKLMMAVAKPLDALIPITSIGGIALVNILAVLVMLVACFFAGLASRSAPGKAVFRVTDSALMAFLPPYAVVKERLVSTIGDSEAQGKLKPVLVKFDDHSVVAFEVERIEDGTIAVFLPGAPDAWAGTVVLVEPSRVTGLSDSNKVVAHILKRLGIGATGLIQQPRA